MRNSLNLTKKFEDVARSRLLPFILNRFKSIEFEICFDFFGGH